MEAVHRVMHSVSASIEYVCSTTAAANSGPTTSLCTAGNATRPIAATEGASATTAVRTTIVAPCSVISVVRPEYCLGCARVALGGFSPLWERDYDLSTISIRYP